MANFQYIALDGKGEQQTGVIQAATEAEVIQQLRAQGLYPTKVVEEGKGSLSSGKKGKGRSAGKKKVRKETLGGKVKPKILMIFTRQLATLVESGLPLLKSLTVLGRQETNPVLRGTLNALGDSVQSGATFSEGLAQHPKIFNRLFVNMVKAGELGGVLEVVLTRLADYQEKAEKLKKKIIAAMVYPLIVLFVAVSILVFLMIAIVPKFRQMFIDMGNIKLPWISRFVFGFSDWMIKKEQAILLNIPNVLVITVLLFIAYIGVVFWGKSKGGRNVIDGIKLRIPILGNVQQKSAIARFSRTLGTLVTSGVPILQALKITRETAGNVQVSYAVDRIHDAVKEGESIVQPMTASNHIFPNMVVSMVEVGEETGQLPEMLLKIADVYDNEVDDAVTALTSILEPVMIIFLAVIVGSIVMALFLPLIQVITNMQ